MKIKSYICMIGAGVLLSGLASCSTITSVIGGGGSATKTEHKESPKPPVGGKKPVSAGEPAAAESHHHGAAVATSETPAHFTEEARRDVFSRLAGEWNFATVKGKKVTGEERPYITFDSVAGRFYGTNGCNLINGDVAVASATEIRFEEIITTTMSCPNADMERAINSSLAEVAGFNIRKRDREVYLDLLNLNRQVVITLRKHDTGYLNGYWVVTRIDGKKVDKKHRPELVIDIPEMRIHGNTGCNIVNGSIYVDPDKDNSIQFEGLGVTRMACPSWSVQTELLVALESVESTRLVNATTVELLDDSGKAVLVLEHADPSQDR